MVSLRFLVFGALALVLTASAPIASATLIDFEGHPDDGNPVINEAGFSFTFSAEGWGVFTDGFVGGGAPYTQNGTTRLVMSGGSPCFVTFKPIDDSPFSLASMDAATMFPGTAGGMDIVGNLEGGGTVNASFSLTGTFANYVLPGTFVNLDSVTVSNQITGSFRQDSGVSLDNILVNPVPEPSTLAVAALALVGLAKKRRRK